MHARAMTLIAVAAALALPATAAATVRHTVQPGESLTSIAETDGLSVAALAAANNLSPTAELQIGEVLVIPPQTTSTSQTTTVVTTQTTTVTSSTHDTQGNGVTSTTSTTGSSSTSGSGSSTGSTGTGTTGASTGGTGSSDLVPAGGGTSSSSGATPGASVLTRIPSPQPTQERVTQSQIATIAEQEGVPPALAEAIAWQESGWNNDEVSSTGAVGVMQLVPSAWRWIDRNLTPGDPLQPDSASDNVRAGVLLIRELLSLTGDNYRKTAAAYFQGLTSIQRHGEFRATRSYVKDVIAIEGRLAA